MLKTNTATDLQNTIVANVTDNLVDLPANENVFNEHLLPAQVNIQQIKISYPKNGLYGLL